MSQINIGLNEETMEKLKDVRESIQRELGVGRMTWNQVVQYLVKLYEGGD